MDLFESEKTVGKRIKAARKNKNMTQRALSEKTGINTTQISKFENGKAIPSIQTFSLLSRALDVSIDYLYLGDAGERFINAASCKEEIIVKCFLKLWELDALRPALPSEKRADSRMSDFLLIPNRNFLQIKRLFDQLTDFGNNRGSFSDGEAHINAIVDSVVNSIKL